MLLPFGLLRGGDERDGIESREDARVTLLLFSVKKNESLSMPLCMIQEL